MTVVPSVIVHPAAPMYSRDTLVGLWPANPHTKLAAKTNLMSASFGKLTQPLAVHHNKLRLKRPDRKPADSPQAGSRSRNRTLQGASHRRKPCNRRSAKGPGIASST